MFVLYRISTNSTRLLITCNQTHFAEPKLVHFAPFFVSTFSQFHFADFISIFTHLRFSFLHAPSGLVTAVRHVAGEDVDVLNIKKGIVGILSAQRDLQVCDYGLGTCFNIKYSFCSAIFSP